MRGCHAPLTRVAFTSQVQLCTHIRTNETVVLKIIKKSWVLQSQQLAHIKEENLTMMQLSAHDCPFVVKTLGSFQVLYIPLLGACRKAAIAVQVRYRHLALHAVIVLLVGCLKKRLK